MNEEPQVTGDAISGEKNSLVNLMGITLIFGAAVLLLVLTSGIFELVANLERI